MNPSGAGLLCGFAGVRTLKPGPSSIVITRKRGPLNEQEHAVCQAVADLRRKMGLSQKQMAKQVGANLRAVSRWERHLAVPQDRYLVRLEQLQRMADDAAGEDRAVCWKDGARPRRSGSEMGSFAVRRVGRQLIGALLAKLGGRVVIEKHDLAPWRRPLRFWHRGDGSFTLEIDERLAKRLREKLPAAESAGQQIDRLARFIRENVPGEPGANEGAVDTAIRLLASRGETTGAVSDVHEQVSPMPWEDWRKQNEGLQRP